MDYSGRIITKTAVTPSQTSAPGVWTLQDQILAQQSNTWPVPGVYNPISRSLRFNSADSAYLNRTFSTPTNQKIWTWSGWVKRSSLTSAQMLFGSTYSTGGNQRGWISFGAQSSTDQLEIELGDTGNTTDYNFLSNAVYRDVGAWAHILIACDLTQATDTNRLKAYVNGVQVTFASATYPAQNSTVTVINRADIHTIGGRTSDRYFNGYLTEINFIDGQALTPSSFGTTDPQTGVWVPVAYTGTYGTNGFYVNFKDNTSTTTIGYDYSGNGNNWTANNFSVSPGSGNDSLTDVPTPWLPYNTAGDIGGVVRGNYATLNALQDSATLANGNLDATSLSSYSGRKATMQLPTTGKWYWETTVSNTSTTAGNWFIFGMVTNSFALTSFAAAAGAISFGDRNDSVSGVFNETTTVFQSASINFATNDILQCAYDADSGKFWFGKNNSWYDSSGTTTGNPATGSNQTLTAAAKDWFPFFQGNNTSSAAALNFGQRPFAYTPPSGYLSLCTTNLPTPTIGATSTTQANDYFNATLYTGTSASQSVTNSGSMQPDLVWIKSRSAATDNKLTDAVRGTTKGLISNTTGAETTDTNGLTAFNSNGFTVGSDSVYNNGTGPATYVAWQWNAGGSNATNTSGSITSTVRANTTAGFSIVTYTGNGSAGATVGHGLGVAPSMVIVKNRTDGTRDWIVYHASIGNTAAVFLNLTNASTALSAYWNNTSPTSSVFSLGNSSAGNGSTNNMVAYCFAPVAGYSAFGSYTVNGSSDGPFVYLGFRPRWILFKNLGASTWDWMIVDTARDPTNTVNNRLFPNLSNAESSTGSPYLDILSNGFKIRTTGGLFNSEGPVIYAAFAETAFKWALGR